MTIKNNKAIKAIMILIFLSVFLFLISITGCTDEQESGPIKLIDVDELYQMIKEGIPENTTLIDVRSKQEYDEGHISGSILIPVDELENRSDELSKDQTVIVYCKVGMRSNSAAQILKDKGFKDIYDVEGGITAWIEKGYPIEIEMDVSDDRTEEKAAENSYAGIVFINAETLVTFMESDMELVIIDVRSEDSYKEGHIPGAINIELRDFENRLDEIPKNKAVVTYCSGTSCQLGKQAAGILLNNGYTEIYVLPGGIIEWESGGFTVE